MLYKDLYKSENFRLEIFSWNDKESVSGVLSTVSVFMEKPLRKAHLAQICTDLISSLNSETTEKPTCNILFQISNFFYILGWKYDEPEIFTYASSTRKFVITP